MKRFVIAFLGLFTSISGAITLVVFLFITSGAYTSYRLHAYKPEVSGQILDRNGKLLRYIYEDEHRIWVELDSISQDLIDATVAMEDHRFYEHFGIDPIAIARAVKVNLLENERQGGSTLTQQFVKNAYLSPQKTISRKINEAYLSLLIESTQSKERILESYLNEVSYGGVYHGVETASKYYFGKSASEIQLHEAAILASLTKAPSYYLEPENKNELVDRQKIVLEKMLEQNYITEEEFNNALNQEIKFKYQVTPMYAQHFTNEVIKQLNSEFGSDAVTSDGMIVKTSLDLDLQQKAEEIVVNEVNRHKGFNVKNGAALVMHPSNGDILVWVGSSDFDSDQIDGQYDVILAKRQPGSTLKPFLYAMALEEGYTAATMLNDVKTTFQLHDGEYEPVNYDSKFHGPVSIRTALANSYNIPATRMVAAMEVPTYINYLSKLSINDIDPSRAGISIALGGYEMRPLDLAVAYTALANQGSLTKPRAITQIDFRNKKPMTFDSVTSEPVIDSSVSYIISDILSDNSARSQAFGSNSLLNVPERKVAVKTGTSNQKRDNWTIGYTPNYVILAWVGNNDNTPMSNVASGLTGASPIWRNLETELAKRYESQWYDRPENIVEATYHKETGGKYCDRGSQAKELFVKGTEPTECIEPVSSAEAKLFEERDGQEVEIMEISKEDMDLFYQNPFALIEKYKDVLQADEKPTRVFIKENLNSTIPDPLTQKHGDSLAELIF